jgi:hypothetical protein
MWPTASRVGGALTPGWTKLVGSGVDRCAMTTTAASSVAQIPAAAPNHGPIVANGRAFQRSSVMRVSRIPWTTTSSGAIVLEDRPRPGCP